jgi:hypothetical protein
MELLTHLRNVKMSYYALLHLERGVLSLGRDFIFTFMHLSNSSSLVKKKDGFTLTMILKVSELNEPSKIARIAESCLTVGWPRIDSVPHPERPGTPVGTEVKWPEPEVTNLHLLLSEDKNS